MKRISILSYAVAFAACSTCSAGTFTVKTDFNGQTVSLTNAELYAEGAAPTGAGDVIQINAVWPYMGITVNDSDTKSMELLASIDRVDLSYGNRFVLNCASDFTLPTSVKGNGTLVKAGAGTLQLASHEITGAIYYDYNVNIDVQGGTLRLPMADDDAVRTHAYYAMSVAAGATLVTVSNGNTQVSSLSGYGTVTNEQSGLDAQGKASYAQLNISRVGPDEGFDGVIAGPIVVRPTGGFLTLRNPASTFTGGVQLNNYLTYAPTGGVLQVTKFANAGEPSSLGAGPSTVIASSTKGGLVRYIGDEDSATDRGISLPTRPLILDAGHHGGVTFNGIFAMYGSTATLSELHLTGSNTVPCNIYGELRSYLVNDLYRPFYIRKSGTGTWRIFDRLKSGRTSTVNGQNAPRGVIEVEDGTLEFDSLANAGSYCALGFAADLYRRETDTPTDADRVEYAWLLGGTGPAGSVTEGRMLYTGAEKAQVTNRPMAIATSGAFGTSQARVRLFDVRPEGTGAKTLALEAPAGVTNDLCDVSGSAESPIGIVKRGEGSWRVGGKVSLGGPVRVESGELVVENRPQGSAYSWFRLVFKQTAATCPRYANYLRPDGVTVNFNGTDKYVVLSELGLYDVNGKRIDVGIVDSSDGLDVQYGQANIEHGIANAITFNPANATTYCIFDNLKPTATGGYYGGMRFSTATQISIDNPATWVPVVFRLTNGAPTAVSCDFVYGSTTSNKVSDVQRLPTAMRLDACNDGVHWETVWESDALTIPDGVANEYRWISNGDSWSTADQRRKVSDGKGFAFSRTAMQRNVAALTSIPHLSVAHGASFRVESDASASAPTVSALSVDGSTGAGTVSGVAFAQSGTIDVTNVPSVQSVAVPLGFAGVEGVGNLNGWVFTIDGEQPVKHTVAVSADGTALLISRKGIVVTVR